MTRERLLNSIFKGGKDEFLCPNRMLPLFSKEDETRFFIVRDLPPRIIKGAPDVAKRLLWADKNKTGHSAE